MGVTISGHLHTEMADGSSMDVVPGDVFEILAAPRRVGRGRRAMGNDRSERPAQLSPSHAGFNGRDRVLATVMFTDIVGSTQLAAQLSATTSGVNNRPNITHWYAARWSGIAARDPDNW